MSVGLGVVLGLLLANIISLLMAYLTPYGKSWIYSTMKTASKGLFIGWNIYMLLVGVTFWLVTFAFWIKNGKGDYSDFKNVTVKQLMKMLNEAWKSKEKGDK